MRSRTLALVLAATVGGLTAPAHAGAQARSFAAPQKARGSDQVPKAYLPPPGMCRIWLDNVPPAQQPAPTDCPGAIRRKPQNARVIFGDADGRPPVPPPAARDTAARKKPPAGH